MADGRTHSKIFTIFSVFFIGLLIWFKLYSYIPLLILSNSIIDPDEDQKWINGKMHRSFITHSVLWSFMIGGAISIALKPNTEDIMMLFTVLLLPTLIHLLLDILSRDQHNKLRFLKDKRVGKYCISFYPFKGRLTGNQTVAWLLINSLFIILFLCAIIKMSLL